MQNSRSHRHPYFLGIFCHPVYTSLQRKKFLKKGSNQMKRINVFTKFMCGLFASLNFSLSVAFSASVTVPTSSFNYTLPRHTVEMNVCFSPDGHCEDLIVQAIRQATQEILVQCYSFTSAHLADALISAQQRGVKVRILFDKSQLTSKFSQISRLKQQDISAQVDHTVGLAHNKIMIIDQMRVITGSYNFSTAANTHNAENLLYIHDPDLAQIYRTIWMQRVTQSITIPK